MAFSSSSCTYTQTFKVVPLIGGFSTFSTRLSECVFEYIPYTPNLTITSEGDSIRVSSEGKSILFYRAVVVFRDEFDSSAGVSGCSNRVKYVETSPVVAVDETRRTLNVGMCFLVKSDHIVPVPLKLTSQHNQIFIARDLFSFILRHNSGVSGVDLPPCSTNLYIYPIIQTVSQTEYQIYYSQPPCSFISWYVTPPGSTTSFNPMPGTTNQFLADNGSTYNIGYSYRDSSGVDGTIYSPVTFPVTINDPPYYQFPVDTVL